jgi:hypothetical protein
VEAKSRLPLGRLWRVPWRTSVGIRNRPLRCVASSGASTSAPCRGRWPQRAPWCVDPHGSIRVTMKVLRTRTLYEVLAAPAPKGLAAGETNRTLAKETLDADDEALLEVMVIGG